MRSKAYKTGLWLSTAACLLMAAAPARASLTDEQRRTLAHSFVNKLKNFYHNADKVDKTQIDHFSSIPDGQELLLQPYLKSLPFADNIYGVKERGQAYLSFENFVDVMYFSIRYDEKTHQAEGWFLREDWKFALDYGARTVNAKGKVYSLTETNSYLDGDELFVTVDALQTWFGIGIKPDLMAQSLFITSDYPFPVQAHKRRTNRVLSDRRSSNLAEYPLLETEYEWLDIKSAQISASTTMRSNPDQPTEKSSNANAVVQGQVLKHSSFITANYDNENKLNSVTGQLFKESLTPELLGPLHARAYYVGDVQQVTMPLTPPADRGLGFNVTNLPSFNRYDLSATAIRGNATPGWDVELYRNNGLVDVMTVGEDGRYEFNEVQLFAGDNDFELLFYGPQGEIRRETVYLPVSQEVISQKDNTYEFASTLTDNQTYRKNPSTDVDSGEIHTAGRYNFLVGDVLTNVGFRNLSVEGENKSYLSSGIITTLFSTILDANTAVDEKGEMAASLQLRRDFGDIDVSLSGQINTDQFAIASEDNPTVKQVNAAARVPLSFLPGQRNSLFVASDFSEQADKQTSQRHNASLASQYGQLNITNTLQYQTSSNDEAPQVDYIPSVSGRTGPVYWRASANYEVEPEKKLENLLLDLKYRHNEEWSGDFSVEHEPTNNFTEYQVGANWNHEKFILTPFINYDSERELYTGVNMRFGLVNPPEGDPIMTSRNISGEGFVSTFVYLDKDGNLKFDGEDEPLPDVMVKSLTISRKSKTDENGMALLNSLPANRQTDINLDTNTLPDPYMISRFKPVSVAVKPGEIIELEMPVQYSGEIDGTLWLYKNGGSVKDVVRSRIALVPLENNENATMQSEALSDGFFVFSLIPSGRYFMIVNRLDAEEYNARRPMPRLVYIGYDAPVLYGQDIILAQGKKDIDFDVLSEKEALAMGFAPVQDRREAEPIYLLRVEKQNSSKLLSLLYAFNSKKMAASYLKDLQRLETPGDDRLVRYFAPERSLEKAYERCALIVDNGLPCSVEALLPPSESFAVKSKGIITTDNMASLGKG